ncbi:MAG TPA: hypothetical protein VI653_16180, partial [Steroidobacteraceae bacterium]
MNVHPARGLGALLACAAIAGCNNSSSGNSSGTSSPTPYAVSVMVTGLSGTGLVLQDSGGDTLPISGNGAFTFSRKLASGNVFYVAVTSQPTNPAQSCEVAGGIGVVSAASTDSVSVTCSAKTSSTDSLGGVVTGLQGSGLVLQDGRGDTLPISANGPFVFPASLLAGTTYTVSVRTPPISPYQDCSVTNSNGTAGATDITGVVVSCQLNSNATEPVSVTVAGLSGAGTTLLLQNNGRDPISVQSDGTYTFATRVPANSPYSVTATVPGTTQSITCTIDAASGVVQPGSPVTVAAQCQKNAFATVQITTSGLAAPSAS